MELMPFLTTWGCVLGLCLDVVGTVVVFLGVRISIEKANALEEVELPRLMDDIGSPENLQRNKHLSLNRAKERVRASQWAGAGLICFLAGFLLQAIGSWPK